MILRQALSHYGFDVTTEPLLYDQLDDVASARCEGGWCQMEMQIFFKNISQTAGTEQVQCIDKQSGDIAFSASTMKNISVRF